MREVEDAHQAVDERQAGGDQEVHRAEAEARDGQQDERAHACDPTLRQLLDELGLLEQLLRVARVHDAALVEHDRVVRDAAHDAEVLLDEQDGRELREPFEHVCHLGHERGREALRRLVDEQDAVVVQQRARDREHLLLASRERARALCGPRLQVGEEVVHEVVARLAVALGEPEVLRDGQAGEDLAVLGHVADAAAARSGASGATSAPRRRAGWSRAAPTSPRIARSVVVFPTPLRPRSAVTPPSGTSKETPWSTCDWPR